MFELVRQRDFIARLGPTQKVMEMEPATLFTQLRAQRYEELRIGPLDNFRRLVHVRPSPAKRSFRGRD
jgi:hypothetical protein